MATFANLTVKKADGTTDVVYTGMASSSGDKTPAIWQNLTVGTTPAEKPTLELLAQPNGPGTARRIRYSYRWPIVQTDTAGNKKVTGYHRFEGSYVTVQSDLTANINEAVYQGLNLLATALVKASTSEGYGPRS